MPFLRKGLGLARRRAPAIMAGQPVGWVAYWLKRMESSRRPGDGRPQLPARVLLHFSLFFGLVIAPPPSFAGESAADLYGQALEALRSGQHEQAITSLQRAVELDPRMAKAHGALGSLYLQLGKFAAAEPQLERARDLDPGNVQFAVNLAHLYSKTDRTAAAIAAYQEILRSHPDLVPAQLGLAATYQMAQQFQNAVKAYQRALELDPRSAESLANLGSCHEALGEEDRAIQCYEACIQLNPKLKMAKGNLGAIYQKRGDLDKGFPLLEDAVRLDPEFTAARYSLALVLIQRKAFDRAVQELEAVLAREPDHVGGHYNLAQAYFRLNRREEGKREMEAHAKYRKVTEEIELRERAAVAEPNNPTKKIELALVYERSNKPRLAADAYRAAIALDSKRADAHTGLAALYLRGGNLDAAIAEYLAALQGDSRADAALDGLARAYAAKNEKLEEAIGLAGKAFALKPLPRYLETLALVYYRSGRQEEALQTIERAIEMDQRNPSLRRTRARINGASGHGDE